MKRILRKLYYKLKIFRLRSKISTIDMDMGLGAYADYGAYEIERSYAGVELEIAERRLKSLRKEI